MPRGHGNSAISTTTRRGGCQSFYPEKVTLTESLFRYSAISRPQFVEEILQPVYNTLPPSFGRTPTAHLNATILFMVFAVGSLMDPGTPPDPGEDIPYPQPSWAGRSASGKDQDPESTHSQGSDSQWYHRLARIALSAGTSIMEDPTIPAVRAVVCVPLAWHSPPIGLHHFDYK